MMCRWLLALAAPLSWLGVPAAALADEPPGCPPGEWFCEDAPPAPPQPPEALDAAEDEAPAPAAAELEDEDEEPPGEAPAVDVPPAPSDGRGWTERSPSRWALAVRGEGVLLDGGNHDARLGGIGASLRFALTNAFTLDLGLDSIVGTDYNGYDRSELSLSLSSVLYLNEGEIVRTYILVGMNLASARVEADAGTQSWGYFGGHAGLGLEFLLDSHIGLNIDVVGFMRGRTDSRAAGEPEFTDSAGRVTNTSGGGLLRGGVVLHFF